MTIQSTWLAMKSLGRQCVQALPLIAGGVRAVRFATAHSARVVGSLNTADVKHARQDPWKVFGSPMEAVKHDALSASDKQRILSSWEEDAKHLAIAEGEGMGGGEPNRLSEVSEAKQRLQQEAVQQADEQPPSSPVPNPR